MSCKLAAVAAAVAGAFVVAGSAFGAVVTSTASNGSPSGTTPQNHQNEPAVAIDANHPNVVVSGWNDFVDWAPCPQADALQFGTCADPADSGVGLSAVAFSFDSGEHWVQPAYPGGWTAAGCDPTASSCTPGVGTIHTLPGYYQAGFVSSGDPAVAIGPKPDAHGHFDWGNGDRVYYANLVGAFPSGFAFPNPEFHGFLGVGVSRLDNPTADSVLQASNWQTPVIVDRQTGQTTFTDKEQIWADNASSSKFFGNVYVCNVAFRSNGKHTALGGNAPAPLTISTSTDGGTTWTTRQVTSAGTNGLGPTQFGLSGCTVRTDSHGVVYVFAEMFQNPSFVGLPTHGYHVMFTSSDGGAHWSKMQIIRQVDDPCFFTDPVYGRCVLDGYAGARTDLSAAPSVDIANGAPTGAGASNEIVDAWADSGTTVNGNTAQLSYSTDGGRSWSPSISVTQSGDRPMYAAPAISPNGDRVYLVYEADTAPWLGADMTSPRPYHGVFETAPIGIGGAPGSWTAQTGPLGDLRATYPGHDIYQERIGDYVYAAATPTYGLGVWTDASDAAVCDPVQSYRAASLAAGTLALPAPWPLADCPATFGNTNILSMTTG